MNATDDTESGPKVKRILKTFGEMNDAEKIDAFQLMIQNSSYNVLSSVKGFLGNQKNWKKIEKKLKKNWKKIEKKFEKKIWKKIF